jgi:cytochrome c oxidase subunit 3
MNQRLNDFSSLRTHPYSIMVYFLLAGLTMLFAALSAAYVYTRVQSSAAPIKIPWIFLLNTVVLYASNWSLKRAKAYYIADDTKGYQIALWGTLILTLLFMALQFVGWKMLLVDNPDTFKGGNMSAYVYAISILHFLHIIGGLPFFIIFLITAYIRMKEPVSVLVYFSDPLKRLRLNLLLLYWHFLDYLWIYLIVFFWANYFIQIPK